MKGLHTDTDIIDVVMVGFIIIDKLHVCLDWVICQLFNFPFLKMAFMNIFEPHAP